MRRAWFTTNVNEIGENCSGLPVRLFPDGANTIVDVPLGVATKFPGGAGVLAEPPPHP
jgi:hypothetical protein